MALFNISSRLSFNKGEHKRRRRRRHRSYHTHDDIKPRIFNVEIGEQEPLEISIENVEKFIVLKEDRNSICVRVIYSNDTDDDVLIVRWSDVPRDANSRDHLASLMAKSIVKVPTYKCKDVFRHFNKYVSVGVRTYIHGDTLDSILHTLSADELDAILLQVHALVWELGKTSSDKFGHIQHGRLATSTPASYLRTCVMIDKMKHVLDAHEWQEQGTDNYCCKAIMCHGNVSPEHIIVDGINVVGIVGWSNGDFVPEVFDRLNYYFRSNPNDPNCWYRKMSEVAIQMESGSPSVEFVINATTYAYKSAWCRASIERKNALNKLWNTIRVNYTVIGCIANARQIESDNMSLDSLTSWWNSNHTVTK